MLKLITAGCRPRKDGESKTMFWVFKDNGETDEEVLGCLENKGVEVEGFHISADYSPTGKWFAEEVDIKRRPGRIIATQLWLLDI